MYMYKLYKDAYNIYIYMYMYMYVLCNILFALSLLVTGHQRGSHDIQEKEKSSSWSVGLSHSLHVVQCTGLES